ncbi:Nitroreductase NfnB (NR NfnB) (FMN-dependent NAD(P)H nitroreductase) [Durusdinium trenchii]|uniref:Nitroreductase NfnB (NR NfnB) (FMN-dependent NAD(P)H nitroreductase) n=1 Tax=Durusdinium trenchii TaxID=1381693 RepID=A0ABP0SHI0_9DINO
MVIQEVVEALRSVPSSANTQPWTIVVVQGGPVGADAAAFGRGFASEPDGLIEAGVLAGDTLWMQVRWEQPSNLEGWTWRHQTWYEQLPKTMIPRMSKAVELFEKEYFEHLGISADQRSKFRSNFERGPQFSLHGVEEMSEDENSFWSAPLHLAVCAPSGPCLKEDPPVDGVFLDMGSAITALSMCAHDRGLAVHCHWQLARFGSVYREVLGSDLPEDHFVVAGLSLGFPIGGRAVQTSPEFLPTRLTVDETTRDSVEASSHGLMHLVQSRHCSHTLETGRAVPKELLRDVLSAARNVFSIGGAQPWSVTVIQGAARDRLSEAMLAYFDAGNNGAQTYKKYSTQNTERMQKGKDMYGFELYEQRHGLQRDDAEGRRAKYRPNYQFWGAPVLLLLNAPKTSSAGTFIDVGSYMQLGVFDVYAILVAMHAYGLGGKPLGSVAKFTELCREVLGPEAMPEDGKWEESRDRILWGIERCMTSGKTEGICIGWPSEGRDPREWTPDWFPSRLSSDETTRWAVDADWVPVRTVDFRPAESSLGIAGGGFRNSVGPEVPWVVGTAETELKGPGKNSNKIQAVPSLGDEEVRQRWQQHIEGSWDPERAAKRIHWLISRLQMQGFNQPEEPNAFGSKIPEAPLAPPVQMAELLEMAKKDQAHQVEVQEEVEPEMEPTSDEREEKQAFDFDGWTQESHYERRRRERRKRRHGRGDERDEKPHDSVAADEFLGGLLHDRSKLGLFFGWLVGRIVVFLLALISTRLGTPIPMDSEIMQLLGAPVHWLLACVAAAWLGSLAVTRFESHSTWKIGCLAACVFTLVV